MPLINIYFIAECSLQPRGNFIFTSNVLQMVFPVWNEELLVGPGECHRTSGPGLQGVVWLLRQTPCLTPPPNPSLIKSNQTDLVNLWLHYLGFQIIHTWSTQDQGWVAYCLVREQSLGINTMRTGLSPSLVSSTFFFLQGWEKAKTVVGAPLAIF